MDDPCGQSSSGNRESCDVEIENLELPMRQQEAQPTLRRAVTELLLSVCAGDSGWRLVGNLATQVC
jgi:hypothetical protein